MVMGFNESEYLENKRFIKNNYPLKTEMHKALITYVKYI